MAESKGFEFNAIYKKNNKVVVDFICKKHVELGVQTMAYNNMRRNIKGCKYCASKSLPEWYIVGKMKEINPNIILLEEYKNLTTSIKYKCIKHNLESQTSMQNILKGSCCVECGKEKLRYYHTLSSEEVQDRINNINSHIVLKKYNGEKEMCDLYCMKHNIFFKKTVHTLFNTKSGCDICYTENVRDRQAKTQIEFEQELFEIHPELLVLSNYVNQTFKVLVKCNKHNYTYKSSPSTLLSKLSCCPKEKRGKEDIICSYIEDLGISITRQKIFKDCKDKGFLPFDCYLDDYNICIEYDGEQHFKPVCFGQTNYDDVINSFHYTQSHDKIKNNYCKKNNIPLLRIPYYDYKNFKNIILDYLKSKNISIN